MILLSARTSGVPRHCILCIVIQRRTLSSMPSTERVNRNETPGFISLVSKPGTDEGILRLLFGRIDPRCSGQRGRLGHDALEALWVSTEGGVQGLCALQVQCDGIAVVDSMGRHIADATVTVIAVVPLKEVLAMCARVLD